MADGKERTATQRALDLQTEARLYLTGSTQAQIAEVIGISRVQVSKDLAKLRRIWIAAALSDFDRIKAEQLAKIDAMEAEYWAAWEKSKTPLKKNTQFFSTGADKKPVPTQAMITSNESAGDVKFLDGVMRCIELRSKITGVIGEKSVSPGKGGFSLTLTWDGPGDKETHGANESPGEGSPAHTIDGTFRELASGEGSEHGGQTSAAAPVATDNRGASGAL